MKIESPRKMLKKSLAKTMPLIAVVLFASSCADRLGFGGRPKGRIGSLPNGFCGGFCNPLQLGSHGKMSEKNCQVYTCSGGAIDLSHLRKCADWSRFLSELTFNRLMQDKSGFTFKAIEPSIYHVDFRYPEVWQDMPPDRKEEIAKEMAIDLGCYFADIASVWHEIISLYGYKSTLFFSEEHSAFTVEDSFSDFLGVYLAGRVLRKSKNFDIEVFNGDMTMAISEKLEVLGAQPEEVARNVGKQLDMTKRNIDIGLDGEITPLLMSGIEECEGVMPSSYQKLSLEVVVKYGFEMDFKISPNFSGGKKLLKIACPSEEGEFIYPEKHFPAIMNEVRKKLQKKYGMECCDNH